MSGDTILVNVCVFALSLAGFVLLALASERPGELLLDCVPSKRARVIYRVSGWLLLAVAVALCVKAWGVGIGITAWLGWLCVAGAALVFSLPRWTEKRKAAKPVAASVIPLPRPGMWRTCLIVLLVGGPVTFAWALSAVPEKPVLRDDALRSQVGPWPFTLAEFDQKSPTLVVRDIPTKAFQVRFCDTCDADIRSAYLKIHKPRSLRGAGIVFNGSRWDRYVEIQLPSNTRAGSELWLTVEGKDGSVHYASVRLQDIAPATAQWFEKRRD